MGPGLGAVVGGAGQDVDTILGLQSRRKNFFMLEAVAQSILLTALTKQANPKLLTPMADQKF